MIKLLSLLEQNEKTLRKGMRDPSVGTKNGPIAKLQQKLIQKNFMKEIPSTSYGIYGPKTKAAVKKFQEKTFPNDPTEWDGIVGTNTHKALSNQLNTKTTTTKKKDFWDVDKQPVKSTDTKTSSYTYPYYYLKQNPTPSFIAKIIKDSYGGIFGNDKEAWVEAAVAAIPDKSVYEKVSEALGQDVERYILTFMSQSELKKIFHTGPSISKQIAWIKHYGNIEKSLENKGISDIGLKQLKYAHQLGFVKGIPFLLVSKRNNLMYLFDKNFRLVYSSVIIDAANYGDDIKPDLEFRGKTYDEWRRYSREYWEGTGAYNNDQVKAIVAKEIRTSSKHQRPAYESWKKARNAAKEKDVYWYIAEKDFTNDQGLEFKRGDYVMQPLSYAASVYHPGHHQWTPAGIHGLSHGGGHEAGYEDAVDGVGKFIEDGGGENKFGLMSLDGQVKYTQWIHGTIKGRDNERLNQFKTLEKKLELDNQRGIENVPDKYTKYLEDEINDYSKGKKSPAGMSSGCIGIRFEMVEKIRTYKPEIVLIMSNKEDKISEIPKEMMDKVLDKLDISQTCKSGVAIFDALYNAGTKLGLY